MKKTILLTFAIFTNFFANAITVKADTNGTISPPTIIIPSGTPKNIPISLPSFTTNGGYGNGYVEVISGNFIYTVTLNRSGALMYSFTSSTISATASGYFISPYQIINSNFSGSIQNGDTVTVKVNSNFTINFIIGAVCIPTANFSVSSPNYINAPVNFTDLSSNSPTDWGWQITSSTTTYTSIAQNPTMTFTASGTYTVYFMSGNSCGQSNLASQTFTVSMPTNINEQLAKSFKIYPNRANDFINIEFEKLTNVEITNIVGQVLYNDNIEKTTVDISNYKPGLYFIKTKNLSYKFIKQ